MWCLFKENLLFFRRSSFLWNGINYFNRFIYVFFLSSPFSFFLSLVFFYYTVLWRVFSVLLISLHFLTECFDNYFPSFLLFSVYYFITCCCFVMLLYLSRLVENLFALLFCLFFEGLKLNKIVSFNIIYMGLTEKFSGFYESVFYLIRFISFTDSRKTN